MDTYKGLDLGDKVFIKAISSGKLIVGFVKDFDDIDGLLTNPVIVVTDGEKEYNATSAYTRPYDQDLHYIIEGLSDREQLDFIFPEA